MLSIENYGMLGDFHCHTVASVHAYSTLRENVEAATRKGLKYLAITDHGTGAPDGAPLSYFENLTSLPNEIDGIRILKGVEANIMDFNGNLDIPEAILEKLDIVIASFHKSCINPGTKEEHTNAYKMLASNPYVSIIGHAGTAEFEFDYDAIVPIMQKAGKIFEINAHTFVCRKKSISNCEKIATLCKINNYKVIVDSDAHSEFELANCEKAFTMLEKIQFPDELIININKERIKSFLGNIGVIN